MNEQYKGFEISQQADGTVCARKGVKRLVDAFVTQQKV